MDYLKLYPVCTYAATASRSQPAGGLASTISTHFRFQQRVLRESMNTSHMKNPICQVYGIRRPSRQREDVNTAVHSVQSGPSGVRQTLCGAPRVSYPKLNSTKIPM